MIYSSLFQALAKTGQRREISVPSFFSHSTAVSFVSEHWRARDRLDSYLPSVKFWKTIFSYLSTFNQCGVGAMFVYNKLQMRAKGSKANILEIILDLNARGS